MFRIQPHLLHAPFEVPQVKLRHARLRLEQLDPSVAVHDDLFHGQVSCEQRLVGTKLQLFLHLEFFGFCLGGELLLGLAALEVLDRHGMFVQDLLRQVRVLGRDAVAVVNLAVFVDLKTAWIIEGLGHGHPDLAAPEAAAGVLSREENRITANASVLQYNEITEDNIDSFHFHGDPSGFPITALIAVPY